MIKKWWMESVGYQIYPKSFYDGNNDGHGDLLGIYKKLPYLKSLGVDLIWICPFYVSPMDDNGYDVADFYDVAPSFGTLDDFKKLLNKAKELGIRIILDLVLNHTSDEHPWFMESRKSKDNPYRDYYIWQKGKSKGLPPTNWGSFFGGSAWVYDEATDEYYMKIFSNKMPDLNWKNEKVQDAMIDVAKYWLDLGVDGFRIDAVAHLARAPFVDAEPKDKPVVLDWFKFSNLPDVHIYLKKMYQKVFKPYDALTIGEVGGEANIESAYQYSAFDSGELNMVFNFDHNWCNNVFDIDNLENLKTDVKRLKEVFNKWQVAFKERGWLPLNWLNHDQPRLISHYGDQMYPLESGKMLATALYLMRGTPFVYQGEEIGMTNYPFQSIEDFNDVSSINRYYDLKRENKYTEEEILFKLRINSRDNPRSAIQWDDTKYAGFSKVKPVVNVNPNYIEINVKNNLENKGSLWYHYQHIFKLRKDPKYKELFVYGTYEQVPTSDELYVYIRENSAYKAYVINSFSRENVTYKLKINFDSVLLNNYENILINDDIITLSPYQAVVLVVKKEQL